MSAEARAGFDYVDSLCLLSGLCSLFLQLSAPILGDRV